MTTRGHHGNDCSLQRQRFRLSIPAADHQSNAVTAAACSVWDQSVAANVAALIRRYAAFVCKLTTEEYIWRI